MAAGKWQIAEKVMSQLETERGCGCGVATLLVFLETLVHLL